ncbi:hypothetical protein GCM10008986_33500 [Salinibacillus aidingensis]|uniref:DUF4145 domain-containing protein n=1 Tax=Salinibacillus aidingensis TaxID=237684 RepID=A0ABN1BRX1_9BACI
MSKFIDFLEKINTKAAQYANDMEKILYDSPSSAIVEARKFAEIIVNDVFEKEDDIDAPYKSSLFEKISYLSKDGTLDRNIQKSLDTVRITGNKAAHPGENNELADAFKLHKEMYNIAIWYYEVYTTNQLTIPVYERPKPPNNQENVQELVKKQLQQLIASGGLEFVNNERENNVPENSDTPEEQNEEDNTNNMQVLRKDLPQGHSYLLREIRRLKDSSQEAIENANHFSHFKDYLHVDRKVQLDLEKILEKNLESKKGKLILLCGNVGDGKSHLLAYLKQKKPDLVKNYKIFNDATESFSPNKDAMETLSEVLSGFSDQFIDETNDHIILAINMGVLHNFITSNHSGYTYERLKEFIFKSNLFSQSISAHFSNENFDILSFGDYQSFELTNNGPISTFYSTLMERVTMKNEDNPFYLALKEDEKNGIHTMVHENYKLLQNEIVQNQVVWLIIESIVKEKLVISARAFLNFIADVVIPDKIDQVDLMSEFDVLNYSLPNLLFDRSERSDVLNAISKLDPIHYRSIYIDDLVINLNTLSNWYSIIDENIKTDIAKKWLTPLVGKDTLIGYSFTIFIKSFIRLTYLTNATFAKNVSDKTYIEFLQNLYYFNKGQMKKIKEFYEEVKTAIFKWKGSPKKDYVYINKESDKFRLAQKMNLKPTIDHINPNENEVLETFKPTIILAYQDINNKNTIQLDIDFPLYNLLTRVQEGYRPNKKDEEDAIKFMEFLDKLMSFGQKKDEMLVYFKADQRYYSISKDDFGSFVFERE